MNVPDERWGGPYDCGWDKPLVKANRVEWKGVVYDSQLEADWSHSLDVWGVEYVYHPGRIYLSDCIYEPDFQLEDDLLLEVKGWHDERIEKIAQVRDETKLKIIVGRTGWIPAGTNIETAGAVWEPTEYVLTPGLGRMKFERVEIIGSDRRYYSADRAYELGKEGIVMFKASGARKV